MHRRCSVGSGCLHWLTFRAADDFSCDLPRFSAAGVADTPTLGRLGTGRSLRLSRSQDSPASSNIVVGVNCPSNQCFCLFL